MDAFSQTPPAVNESADGEPVRHDRFYFDDSTVIFRVQDTLFGVHRSSFARHSPVFREMWTLPATSDSGGEGTSDDHPIVLEGITVSDFEHLLDIIYPSDFGVTPFTTLEDWQTVLSVATRFDFQGIRTVALNAIKELPGLTAVQKIVLSRELGIRSDWIVVSLTELAARTHPITESESRALGIETFTLLAQAREQIKTNEMADTTRHSIICADCADGGAMEIYCRHCDKDLEAFYDDDEAPPYLLPSPMQVILSTFQLTREGRPIPS